MVSADSSGGVSPGETGHREVLAARGGERPGRCCPANPEGPVRPCPGPGGAALSGSVCLLSPTLEGRVRGPGGEESGGRGDCAGSHCLDLGGEFLASSPVQNTGAYFILDHRQSQLAIFWQSAYVVGEDKQSWHLQCSVATP